MSSNKEKSKQLGMSHGTAANRLRKQILFYLLKLTNANRCYRCGKMIESEKELSIDHVTPWLHSDDPVGLFFDLDNMENNNLEV